MHVCLCVRACCCDNHRDDDNSKSNMARQKIFLSYATVDRSAVERIRNDIEADASLSQHFTTWMDCHKIKGGHKWEKEIETNIETCHVFLVFVSPASNASEWVQRETIKAEQLCKPRIPILLDGGELPLRLLNVQYVDFRVWSGYSKGLTDLVDVLGAHLNNSSNNNNSKSNQEDNIVHTNCKPKMKKAQSVSSDSQVGMRRRGFLDDPISASTTTTTIEASRGKTLRLHQLGGKVMAMIVAVFLASVFRLTVIGISTPGGSITSGKPKHAASGGGMMTKRAKIGEYPSDKFYSSEANLKTDSSGIRKQHSISSVKSYNNGNCNFEGKYYLYLSEYKLKLLHPQSNDGDSKLALAARRTASNLTRRRQEPSHEDLSRLQDVCDRFRRKDMIGSPFDASPKSYVEGTFPLRYGILEDYAANLVYFGNAFDTNGTNATTNATTILSLIGSSGSVIGSSNVPTYERNAFYYAIKFLNRATNFKSENVPPPEENPMYRSASIAALDSIPRANYRFEFLAKVIYTEPNLIVASPLYVAMA